MKRSRLRGASTRRVLLLPIVVLALIGCDGAVNVNPVAPSVRPSMLGTERGVDIVGSLTAEQGGCVEATILYDGREVAGARVGCAETDGCARLNLSGFARSASGHHTIAFQVLRQSEETVDYLVQATISVSRDGLSQVVTLALEPVRATLRVGQTVSFEVDFRDALF